MLVALQPTVVTVAGSGRDEPRAGRPVLDGDALVLATSGTTGPPKGVVLTTAAVRAAALATSSRLRVDPARDAWLCCLPLAHAGGLGVVTRALVTNTPLTVLPGFDPTSVVAAAGSLAAAGRAVLTSLVATALRRIDPGLFRIILLGGDAPPAWPGGRPPPVVVTYGLTETGGGCVYDGVPLDGVEVRVVDGEILVRGPVVGRSYRERDGERPVAGADGWLATGDGGRIEGDGRLVVDGRLGDVIVTGGEKVWPRPVEDVIRGCTGVRDVAVIGRPDEEWGHRVVALVVPDPASPPTLESIRGAVREALPPWAAPKEMELVAALPTTALGKLQRASLR
ncbi:MAG: o-succinylbenzoate--CoA ligase [Acidimicrobiales bacterium]